MKEKKRNRVNFHFGFLSFVLLGLLFFGSQSLAKLNTFEGGNTVFLHGPGTADGDLFLNQRDRQSRETPDLKLSEGGIVYGISTPTVTSTQTLGALFGGQSDQDRTEVVDHIVEPGDTLSTLAIQYGISENTILWANGLSKNTALKTGQDLVILPVDGVIYSVKTGDTIGDIAKKYKAGADDIITFNSLAGEGDIYVGDTLIVPGGVVVPITSGGVLASPLPKYTDQTPVAGFISPLPRFELTQGMHFQNATDMAALGGCGSPVYAAAGGTVIRAKYDKVGGNFVEIDHGNGVKTYYGHLSSMLVKPGDKPILGQQIGTEGKTGKATGCHVHFQVLGAVNYIAAKYHVKEIVDLTKK